MAKQMGIFPIKGTIGNVTFLKTIDGFSIRQKGGISAERIATDPKFKRTRENIAEFGASAKGARIIRKAFAPLLMSVADPRMFSRLARTVRLAMNADTRSERGARNMTNGNPLLLQGFEFNKAGNLEATLSAPFTAKVDRRGGQLSVELPAFVPQICIRSAESATHFSLVAGGAAIDFGAGTYEYGTAESGILPLGNVPVPEQSLSIVVSPDSAVPLMIALGVRFFQKMNGSFYPLSNGSYNPLAIVHVEG